MMANTFDAPRKRRSGGLLRYVLVAPFRVGWWMATRIEKSTGILFTLVVGALLLGAGFILSSTLLGMVPGIPLMIAGGFLVLRALY